MSDQEFREADKEAEEVRKEVPDPAAAGEPESPQESEIDPGAVEDEELIETPPTE